MNLIAKLLFAIVVWVAFPYLVLFTGLIFLAPIIIPVYLWLWYEKHRDKKRLEMVIAANAATPGSYCEECLCQLAGNRAEHPHAYSCSHSKELYIPKTKRSDL